MSFFDDAQRVFETASNGEGGAAIGILVDDSGALRIVDAEGWRPEALQAHYGARTVFQVTRDAAGVRVAARSGGRACTFTAQNPFSVLPDLPLSCPFSEARASASAPLRLA